MENAKLAMSKSIIYSAWANAGHKTKRDREGSINHDTIEIRISIFHEKAKRNSSNTGMFPNCQAPSSSGLNSGDGESLAERGSYVYKKTLSKYFSKGMPKRGRFG